MVCKLERATSESLEAPVEELREYVRSQDAGADETSWRENRSKAWLWVAVTQVATVFFAMLELVSGDAPGLERLP